MNGKRTAMKFIILFCMLLLAAIATFFGFFGGTAEEVSFSDADGSVNHVALSDSEASDSQNPAARMGTLTAVYLGGSDANDTNSGVYPTQPVATFAKAKELLVTDGYIYIVGTVTVTGDETWTLPAEEYSTSRMMRYGAFDGALVTLSNGASLTLENIILDGGFDADDMNNAGSLITVAEDATVTVGNGAYLQNNNTTTDGGALTMSAGTVNFNNGSTVRYCSAANGGAIAMTGGALNIGAEDTDQITITTNVATAQGGALYVRGGTLNIGAGTFSGNWSTDNGGAFYVSGGTLSVNGGNISDNKATAAGGALYIGNGSATVGITGGTWSNNNAESWGGVIYAQSAWSGPEPLNIQNAEFIGNSTAANGGVIHDSSATAVNITDCVFDSNSAYNNSNNEGGALYFNGAANITITDSKFTNNSADLHGGAIRVINNNALFTLIVDDNSENAVFDNNRLTLNRDTDEYGYHVLTNCAETHIKGYTFIGGSARRPRGPAAAVLAQLGTTTVEDCHFQGNNSQQGLQVQNSAAQLTVKNTDFYGYRNATYSAAIVILSGRNHLIENCTIGKDDPASNSEKNAYGIRMEGGSGLTVVKNTVIKNGTSWGISFTPASALILENTVITGNAGGINLTNANAYIELSGTDTHVSGNGAHSGTLSGDVRVAKGAYIQLNSALGADEEIIFSTSTSLGTLVMHDVLRMPQSLDASESGKFKFAGEEGTSTYDEKFGITREAVTEDNLVKYTIRGGFREKLGTVNISNNGSDEEGDGTSNNPYKTFTEALKWASNPASPTINMLTAIDVYDEDLTLTNVAVTGGNTINIRDGAHVTINQDFRYTKGWGRIVCMNIAGGVVDLNCRFFYSASNTRRGDGFVTVSGNGTLNMNSGAYFRSGSCALTKALYKVTVNGDGALVNIYDGARLQYGNSSALEYGDNRGQQWGGIRIYNGTVNMYGGEWTGTDPNSTDIGVLVNGANAVFNMYGGTFKGGASNFSNAAVWVNNGTFNMSGGVIDGIKASPDGLASGIRVSPNGKVNFSGSAKVVKGDGDAIAISSLNSGDDANIRINGDLTSEALIDIFPNVDENGGIVVKNDGSYAVSKENFNVAGIADDKWRITDDGDLLVDGIEYTDVYVSNSGDDNNPGSSVQPFRTLTKAFEKIAPGGVIWIMGQYNVVSEAIDGTSKIADDGTRVTIKAYSSSPKNHWFIWMGPGGAFSLNNINIDGANSSAIGIGIGNADVTIENAKIANFKITATYTTSGSSYSVSYGVVCLYNDANSKATFKNVEFSNNVAPTVITADRFNSLTLEDVTFANNTATDDIWVYDVDNSRPATINIAGRIVMEHGITYGVDWQICRTKTINVTGDLDNASEVIINNWIADESNLVVVQKTNPDFSGLGSIFRLTDPAYGDWQFNGAGQLRLPMDLYKKDAIYLDPVNGKDVNSGENASNAVNTLAQALSLLKEGGTIYLVNTYTSIGTMINRETIEGTASIPLNFAPASNFTGSMFRVNSGGYLTFRNVNIQGTNQPLEVAVGGTLRLYAGVTVRGFQCDTFVNTSGTVNIQTNINTDAIEITEGGALFRVNSGGSLNVSAGDFVGKNTYAFVEAGAGSTVSLNGAFTAFSEAVRQTGGAVSLVGSPTFTNNTRAFDLSGGALTMYGGTINGATIEGSTAVAPVYIHGGTLNMRGGSILGQGAPSAVEITSGNLNVYGGTIMNTSGAAISATTAIRLEGSPTVGLIVTNCAMNAASYSGNMLTVNRTDTLVSNQSVISIGGGIAEKFNLVDADGNPLRDYALAVIDGDLIYCAQFTITFDLNGGLYNGGTTAPQPVLFASGEKFGTKLPTAEQMSFLGYEFVGWLVDGEGDPVTADDAPTANCRLVAKWTPALVNYTVYYYFENVNNTNYTLDTSKTQLLQGYTGSTVELAEGFETAIDGFTFNAGHVNNIYIDVVILADGSAELRLYYKRNEYTITIHTNGGDDGYLEVVTAKYGAAVKAPTVTRKGYTLRGFYTTNSFTVEYTFSTMPFNGADVYCAWNANTYLLTFSLGSGSTSNAAAVQARQITYDSSITGLVTDPSQFTKSGYTFMYWAIDGTPITNGTLWEFDSDKRADAVWLPDGMAAYRVEHYLLEPEELESSVTLFATPNTEAKVEIKSYVGFTYDSTRYFRGSSQTTSNLVPSDGSLVVRVYYVRNRYDVTFDTAGGSTVNPYRDVPYGEPFEQPQETSKTGYVLEGYYAGSDPSVLWTFGRDTMPDHDLILHAKWRPIGYTVVYNANGGSGTVRSQALTYDGASVPARDNAFTRPGYTFRGWSTLPSGGVNYDEGDILYNLTTADGYIFSLFAVWEENEYTVSFRANDIYATGSMDDVTLRYEQSVSLPANAFQKPGYEFAGWALTSTSEVVYNNSARVSRLTAEQNGKVYLYATWSPAANTPYSVQIFYQNADDGGFTAQSPYPMTGTTNNVVSYNPPEQVGFTYNEAISTARGTVLADGSLVLKIYYNRDKYNMNFTVDEGNTVTVAYPFDAATAPIVTPEKFGYTFVSWQSGDGEEYNFGRMPAENVNLTAVWAKNRYTIIFNGNGSTSGMTESVTVEYDETATTALTMMGYRRTGYTFASWNTSPDGKGVSYARGSQIPNNLVGEDGGSVRLYAQWTVNHYTVTFNPDSAGVTAPAAQTLSYGSRVTKPESPTKRGYAFIGWTYNDDDWDFFDDTVPESNITLKAKYQIINYTISWHLGGGRSTGTMPATYTVESGAITLPAASTMSKTGNNFNKWVDTEDYSAAGITSIAAGSVGNKHIYAIWTPQQYTVSFETFGGFATPSIVLTEATTIERPANPTRLGYEFGGWYKARYGSGDSILGPDWNSAWNFETDKVAATGSMLFAKWTPIPYTIHYDLGGGAWGIGTTNPYATSYTIVSDTVTFNSDVTPVRAGYTFVGWDTESIETGSYGDKTVAAQWRVNTYSVAFNSDGGSYVEGLRVNYGALIARPSDPVKEGFVFEWWYTGGDPLAVWSFERDTMPNSGLTLTAYWSRANVTVVFDVNGGSVVTPLALESGSRIPKPNDPVKVGYEFGGWYKERTLSTAWNFATDPMPVSSITLYAKWTPTVYHISYQLNGGEFVSGNTNPGTYTIEDSFDFVGEMSKSGYTFVRFTPNRITTGMTGDITVQAVFSANDYQLFFDVNNASDRIDPIKVTMHEQIGALPTPIRLGYQFSGWSIEGVAITPNDLWDHPGDRVALALWSAQVLPFTVNFYLENADDDDYSLYETVTRSIRADSALDLKTEFGSRYRNFTYSDTYAPRDNTVKGDGTTVFNLYYTRDLFRIDFQPENGSTIEPYIFKHGASISAPSEPTMFGASLEGWYNNDERFEFTVMPAQNVPLRAQWNYIEYQINYVVNGGTISGDYPRNYFINSGTVTLPTEVIRSEYLFNGWFINADFRGEITSFYAEDIAADITVYACWGVETQQIGFESNGGTPVASITADPNATITEPAAPTREGYTFDGWYEDNNVFSMRFVFGQMFEGSVILYAKWIPILYAVTFDPSGGQGTMSTMQMWYGVGQNLPYSQFTREGYTFTGWNTSRDGSGTAFADGETVMNLFARDGGIVALYAQWRANTYTVRFAGNSNDVQGIMEDLTLSFDTSAGGTRLPENTFARVGYDFAGWNTSADGTGADYSNAAMISGTLTSIDGDVVILYAQWTAKEYELAFDPDGGTGTANSIPVMYGAAVPTLPTVERDGYIFDGWRIVGSDNSIGITVSKGDIWNYAENKTVIAVWKERADILYTVEYYQRNLNDNNFTLVEQTDYSGTMGATVTLSEGDYANDRYTGFVFNPTASQLSGVIAADGSLVLAVRYDRNVVTVQYLDADGAVHDLARNVKFGAVISAPTLTKTGYTFDYWKDATTGTEFNFESGAPAENLLLTAEWHAIHYSVVFNPPSGATAVTQQFAYDDIEKALTANNFTRTGYNFIAWNTQADGKGVSYSDKQLVRNLSSVDGARVNLYPQWIAKSYVLTLRDGNTIVNEFNVVYDGIIGTLSSISKFGYSFDGWMLGSNLITENTVWNFTTNQTATAVWTTKMYTVKYMSVVSGITNTNVAEYTAGSGIITLTDASKTGYTFEGWFTESEFINQISSFAADSENKIIYAKWSLNAPSVTINSTLAAGGAVYNPNNTYTLTARPTHTTSDTVTYTYVWYKGGQECGSSASITVGDVNDSAIYRVVVTALANTLTSTAEATFTVTITKANISPSVTLSGWTYGESADTPAVSGNAGDGAVTYSYAVKNGATVGSTPPKNAGTYVLTVTVAATDNYNRGTASVEFTVAARTLTITWGSTTSWTYDAASHAPTATLGNFVTGEGGTATVTGEQTNVGNNYTATVSDWTVGSGTVKTNYVLPTAKTKGFSISNAEFVTFSVTPYSGTYDGANHNAATYSVTTVGTNTVTYKWGTSASNLTTTMPTVNAFTAGTRIYYEISAANHTTKTGSVVATVAKRELTITWGSQVGWTYDAASHVPTAALGNFVTGQSGTATVTGAATNVGNHTATVGDWTVGSGTVKTNYVLPTANTIGFSISNAEFATFEITGYSGTYDGANHNAVIYSVTTVGTNTITYKWGTSASNLTTTMPTVNAYTAGTRIYYEISAPNHTTKTGSVVATVDKRVLTVTAEDKSVIYGDVAPQFTVTYQNFAPGETMNDLGGALAFDCDYVVTTEAGSVLDIEPKGYTSDNYQIVFVNGTISVEKRQITVTVNSGLTSVYGSEIVELGYTLSENAIVNDDQNVFTLSTPATATANVGLYDVILTVHNNNYAITLEGGTNAYTITAAQITDVTIDSYVGVYDRVEHDAVTGYGATSVYDEEIIYYYRVNETDKWLTAMPRFVNAGEYTVYYRLRAANHDEYLGSITVVIEKAIVYAPVIEGKPYDGTHLVADVEPNELYEVTSNEGSSHLGDFDVVLTLVDPANYKWELTDEASFTVVFNIYVIENVWTQALSIDNWTYAQEASDPVVASVFGEIILTYKKGDQVLPGRPTEAGTYKLIATVEETSDYNGLEAEVEFTIYKAKYDLSGVSFVDQTFDNDGTEHSIVLKGTLPEGLTASYEGNGNKDVGEYVVTVTFDGDWDNYEYVESMSVVMTIIMPVSVAAGFIAMYVLEGALGATVLVVVGLRIRYHIKKKKNGPVEENSEESTEDSKEES